MFILVLVLTDKSTVLVYKYKSISEVCLDKFCFLDIVKLEDLQHVCENQAYIGVIQGLLEPIAEFEKC